MPTQLSSALFTLFRGLRLNSLHNFSPETSRVEQDLADVLILHSKPKWFQQVEVKTGFGSFFLDMGCRVRPDRALGVECDGHPFHQDKLRDFCRDALILGTGRLNCIYRLDAWAVHKRRIDWLRVLSELEPDLLTDEAAESIRELGSGYDQFLGRRLLDRHYHFMSRLTSEMASVREFLEFAQSERSVTFRELVERVRLGVESLT